MISSELGERVRDSFMKNRLAHWATAILILGSLLALAGIASLCLGSADIPFAKILPALVSTGNTIEHTILCDVRLPRIFLGIAVGGALSLAGVILQGMFRNPLVEPYTMGY